jgi:Na+/H+ antiporter NhaD/arsenite permease-like protein
LSAIFSNDIICLAMTPVVAQLCLQRKLDPVPFLVGLACAANIGSAATLIGNPQNMLIGSVLHLPFGAYVRLALPPVVLSLLVLWVWLVWGPGLRTSVGIPGAVPSAQPGQPRDADRQTPLVSDAALQDPPFNAWQTAKGLCVATALLLVFLFTGWPREVAALVGAGVLLLSRRFHSSDVMGFIDWELLVLFIGLFVVNHAFEATGLAAHTVATLAAQGVHLADSGSLFVAGVGLSNLVSNVPAVMLLLPHLKGMTAGVTLALVSTFAGNLLLVGSIANLIVADLAQKSGVAIDWRAHARIGLPVTLLTLVIVWVWLR